MKDRLDDRIGLCYFFHTGSITTEWSTLGGDKYVYIDQTTDSTDWTHYVVAEQAPATATGISVRARFTSRPLGTAWFDDFSVVKMVPVTGVAVDDESGNYIVPTQFKLVQNYPNPFNPETNIQFDLPHSDWVRLDIYNMLGQRVRTLVNGPHATGQYEVKWNARDDQGQPVSSGVYFYTLTTRDIRLTNKMLLIR